MILQSRTSGRTYELALRNTGGLFLSRISVTPDAITPFRDRCLVNDARTNAYSFEINDADLNNPLVVLRQQDVLLGRAYTTLFSPNGREWELTCTQDGVYRVKALSTDWPKAGTPILADPTGLPWRFEVGDDGLYQVTSDASEVHRRTVRLKTQDGLQAYQITVDAAGMLSVSDLPFPTDAQFYDAELIGPTGTRWLLRVDPAGVLYLDSEWQDAIDQGDEWPLLLADYAGTLYCVDTRFPPPVGGYRSGRGVIRAPW